MPFITPYEKIPAFKITKRLGRPNQCGWAICGWSQCGDVNDCSGVYQQRVRRLDFWTPGYTPAGKKDNFIMKPAWPSQPPSEARDAQQAKFSTALSMWQALTNEQKQAYNLIATRRSRRGYDYFMSKTLKSL